MSCYADAVKMLGRRDLSISQMRARLSELEHPSDEVERALQRLQEDGSLDDGRLARAYARTAAQVKGRGRLRIRRELHEMGIAPDVIAQALADVFSDLDERAMIDRAIRKKLRGTPSPRTAQERGRLYQFLMRQGFTADAVSAALRRLPGPTSAPARSSRHLTEDAES